MVVVRYALAAHYADEGHMGFVPINLAVSEEELIKVLALPPSKAVPLAAAASHLLS